MENLTQGHPNVDAIVAILPAADEAMAGAERWLRCRDQAKLLTESVGDVLKRAEREMTQAYFDHRIRSESARRLETMGMVFDIAALLLGGRGQARSKREIKTPMVPRVVIAVGPEGIPVDMSVVNISELAEQEGKADSWVERHLADKGYVLLTIERFKVLASWLQPEVLSGKASLPYHPATGGSEYL